MDYYIQSKRDLRDFLDSAAELNIRDSISYEVEKNTYIVSIRGEDTTADHDYFKFTLSVYLTWLVLCNAVEDIAERKGLNQAEEDELFEETRVMFEGSKYYQMVNYLLVSDSLNSGEIFNVESFKTFSMRSLYEEILLVLEVMLDTEKTSTIEEDATTFIRKYFGYDKNVTRIIIQLSEKGETAKIILENECGTQKDELNEEYFDQLTKGLYPLEQNNYERAKFGSLEESYFFFSIAMGVFDVSEVVLNFTRDVPEDLLLLWNELIMKIQDTPFNFKSIKQE